MSPAQSQTHRRALGLQRALKRYRAQDDPDLVAAERVCAYEAAIAHARKLVAKWPPMTPEQIAHVASVLSTGATGGGD